MSVLYTTEQSKAPLLVCLQPAACLLADRGCRVGECSGKEEDRLIEEQIEERELAEIDR